MSGPFGASQWMYASGAEFDIGQSLKFNDNESQYLSWTPASAGNRKTWTWSGWVKRANITTASSNFLFYAGNASSIDTSLYVYGSGSAADKLQFEIYDGSNNYYIRTNALFRDPSAWYHIVAVMDTTQATSSNRMKLYVNGEQITSFSTATYPTQNYDAFVNSASYEHALGRRGTEYADFYLADVYFIDGQALDPTSFGETVDGYWKPIDYDGTYGTNGFHLNFKDDIVSEGFNTVTYTGNNTGQSISGLGFSPDLVWAKSRTSAYTSNIFDSVRGANKTLGSDVTNAEATATDKLMSFDADGFTLGADQATFGGINYGTGNYVAWCWDAGTGSAASNTDGSITSTVKANPSYGFSVVSYTGTGSAATIGHGLSSAPDMVIVKSRSDAYNWGVYHSGLTSADYALQLNTTIAQSNTWDYWNDTAPTSSVFSVGTELGSNKSGSNYIAYCFHSVSGYSSFGSYTGTGATGNAVTGLGFKPAFLMVKRTDSANSWMMLDNTRTPYGRKGHYLYAEQSFAETYYQEIDFDNDGFTLQATGGAINASGGTYIYMAFADTREYAFWKDVSGNGNHWTPNNLDYRDSLPDTPTNNWATLNPLSPEADQFTVQEGNLKATTAVAAYNVLHGTFGISSGKWYWEVLVQAVNSGTGNQGRMNTGVQQLAGDQNNYIGADAYGWSYNFDGKKINSGAVTTYGSPFYTAYVLGVALDMNAGSITFYNNGTSQGTAFTNVTGEVFPALSAYQTGGYNSGGIFNFGQDSTFAGAKAMGSYTDDNGIGNFQYAPPSGYLALCTSNLPTPTIVDGSLHFNTVLWTSNGGVQSITGVGFQPELWWGKTRSSAGSHYVEDVVRGATNYLLTNSTNAEGTDANYLTSFDADGFSMGTNQYASGTTMVAWNWKAGGTAVSNTDGSITSQVSAGEYMSICTYSGNGTAGATVGHGLGKVPKLLFIKCTSTADNWAVGKGVGSNQWLEYARLNDTAAFTDGGYGVQFFNDTAPTSSVFSLGTINDVNDAARDYVAYAFADLEGACKIGTYTGNGSTDGPFVYTGGRVQWLMIKRTDGAAGWYVEDASRNEYNVVDKYLTADSSDADSTLSLLDFVSNGFKLRTSATGFNASGGSYIYLAIMETPLKNATAR